MMITRSCFLLLFGLLCNYHLYSQTPAITWEKLWEASQTVVGSTTAFDANGNALIGGLFSSTVDLDPGAAEDSYTPEGAAYYGYLVCLDPQGAYLWSIVYDDEVHILEIEIAANGDIIVGGEFRGEIDFDPGDAVHSITSNGLADAFVARYNSSGELIWVNTYGDTLNDSVYSLDSDATGNVYVCGSFRNDVDFDPGIGEHILSVGNVNSDNGYMVKFDATGNFQWVEQSASTHGCEFKGVRVTPEGDLYTAGYYNTDITFDIDGSMTTLSFPAAMFIAKYNSSGAFQWAKTIEGNPFSNMNGVDIDEDGNLLISGGYTGTCDFDPGDGVLQLIDDQSYGNAFLARYNPQGEIAGALGFGNPVASDGGTDVFVGQDGMLYLTGTFNGTVDFDPAAATYEMTAYGGDLFILALNTDLEFQWAWSEGSILFDVAWGVAAQPDGSVLLVSSRRYDTNSDQHAVLTKFAPSSPNTIEGATISSSIQVSPNPTTSNLNVRSPYPITNISWLSLDGRMVLSTKSNSRNISLPTDALTPGVYMINVETTQGAEMIRVVVE